MFVIEIIWSIVKPLLTTKGAKYAALAVIVVCGTFYGGMHYEGLREGSRQKDPMEQALVEFTEQAEKDGLFTKEIEVIKIQIVEKEIEGMKHAVKTDLCVNNKPTPDFRMLYSRSVRLANTTSAP